VTKMCSVCGCALVPLENWTQGNIKARCNTCRACVSARSRKWNSENKDKAADGQRKRNAAAPEKYAEIKRRWRARNPDRAASYALKDASHRRSLDDRRRKPQSPEHIAKRMAASATRLALVKRPCIKCGVEFTPTNWAQKYCSGMCWNSVARKKREKLHRISVSKKLYSALLLAQGGACAICGVAHGQTNRTGRLAVDHCHDQKRIRGLLCHRCNTSLGLMRENPELLRQAALYIEKSRI